MEEPPDGGTSRVEMSLRRIQIDTIGAGRECQTGLPQQVLLARALRRTKAANDKPRDEPSATRSLTLLASIPYTGGIQIGRLCYLRIRVSDAHQPTARGAGSAHPGEIWCGAGDCAGAPAEDRDGRGGFAGVL